MKTVKTAELTGAALDWAVAKAEDDELAAASIQYPSHVKHYPKVSPSTDWAQGGPIIEREHIDLSWAYGGHAKWSAWPDTNMTERSEGPTALIAAMRCFCCSKLGNVIDIPEELCQQLSN